MRFAVGSTGAAVILRCEPAWASLEGWPQATDSQPSFEPRRRRRAPQDDGAI